MGTARHVRIGESRAELSRVNRHFQSWLSHRYEEDRERRQYHSQLGSLAAFMEKALAELERHLDGEIDGTRERGDVYEQCRLFDLRVLWLERVWAFFREKVDQRDDPVLAPALKAADDVAWSCYRQAFDHPGKPTLASQGPAPLPFIESRYSPEAFPSDLVPLDLTTEVELGFLRAHLASLPIPVVRLPPACIEAPWWLILLAHEVGHHVQYDLLDDGALVAAFESRVGLVAQRAGGDEARWEAWSREVFADAFSLASVGPWALWAIGELELRAPAAMTVARDGYPAPAVRLALMAEMLGTLGLDASAALQGMRPDDLLDGAPDPTVAPLASAALAPLPGADLPFRDLCDLRPREFGAQGRVAQLAADLLSDGWHDDHEPAEDGTRGARLAVTAATAAWAQLWAAGGDQPSSHREQLAARTRTLIERSREEGTRVAAPRAARSADTGVDVVSALLAATPEQLGA